MNWGMYGILIIFGLFVLLLVFNPNLSCFGRTIRSPLYPLFRKRTRKKIKAEDYGFHLVNDFKQKQAIGNRELKKKEDYGFHLKDGKGKLHPEEQGKKSERN